jgi:hypothetical protein
LSIWEAERQSDFERYLEPFKKYYAEIMEILPVITSREAQIKLIQMAGVEE